MRCGPHCWHGVKQVLIAYDNDPAGNEAAVKLASSQPLTGSPRSRTVPGGHGCERLSVPVAEPEQAFGVLLDGAVPMSDWPTREYRAANGAEPAHLTALAADVAALPAVSALRRASAWKPG